MDLHMNCRFTSFANKFVGMHVSSVSSFGGKSKAQNRTSKPSYALKGHYRWVSFICLANESWAKIPHLSSHFLLQVGQITILDITLLIISLIQEFTIPKSTQRFIPNIIKIVTILFKAIGPTFPNIPIIPCKVCIYHTSIISNFGGEVKQ